MTQERLEIPIDVDLTPLRTTMASFDTTIGRLNKVSLAPIRQQFAGLQKMAAQSLQIEAPEMANADLSVTANTSDAAAAIAALQTPVVTPLSVESTFAVDLPTLDPVDLTITADASAIDAANLSKQELAQPVEIQIDTSGVSVDADTSDAAAAIAALQTPVVTPLSVESTFAVDLPTLDPVDLTITADASAIDAANLSKQELAQPVEIQIDTSGVSIDAVVQDTTSGLGAITTAAVHTQAALDQMVSGNAIESLGETKTVMGSVASAASNMQFQTNMATKSLKAMAVVTSPLKLLGNQVGFLAGSTNMAANGAAQLAGGLGVISGIASYAATGLGLILVPLSGLVIVPKLVMAAFTLMFKVIIAPFRAFFAVTVLAAKGVWALAQPFIALAAVVFKARIFFASLKLQISLLVKFMSFLPPKIRVVVGGLALLGMTGRAGAAALKLVSLAVVPVTAGFQALKVVLSIATLQFRSAIVNLAALSMSLGRVSLQVGRLAIRLAKLTFSAAVSGMRNLGKASLNVTKKIGGGLVGAMSSAIRWGTGLAAIGVGWGVKLAADAEQAQVAFQTMLKSGDAARAVLGELEQFAASTPFQLNDLRDGAKQLLNAQVPAQDLTKRLTMLGDIAAGTGKPINDFVRIFAKVKSTGKVSLETLNQLAERGVPIYGALGDQLGKSRTEMLKMIGSGKVGFNDLDAALKATATGAGVFAGGMAAQSQTVTGLFSTLKDNVSFAMRALGEQVTAAFDFKGLMAQGIALFQSIKAGIASATPVFTAMATVVQAAFGAVWEVVSVTFNAITSALGITGGNWMESFVVWAAVASFAFKNWPTIAELAFVKTGLFLVQLGSKFMHLFTGVIPALLAWFYDNFTGIFTTAASAVGAVFTNMGKNIVNAMTAIWNFIKSGGTSSLEFAWTPLLDGFENTVKSLPDIPERAVGALEKSLQGKSKQLGSALSTGLATEIGENLKMLDDFKLAQVDAVKPPSLADIQGPDEIKVEENLNQKSEQKSTLVESLDRGSTEALKAIFAGQNQDKTAQKQLTVQTQIKNGIMKLVAKPSPEIDVAGAAV